MEVKNKKANSRLYFNTNNNLLKCKRSQVAIFIIIAILLVVAVVLVFFLWKGPIITTSPADPQSYMDSCIKDNVKEAVNIFSKQGGYINPELTIQYKGENVTYLCYNQGFYKPCINQAPMLIENIEKDVTNYIRGNISDCFSSLKAELEGKGYDISMERMDIKTNLQSKRIIVNVEREFTMSKAQETKSFNNFETKISTPLYELSEIAMEIVNQEAEYCNFENLGFMIIYPQYDIRKENVDGSLIYNIKDLENQQEFKFAVRGCVMPAGL